MKAVKNVIIKQLNAFVLYSKTLLFLSKDPFVCFPGVIV